MSIVEAEQEITQAQAQVAGDVEWAKEIVDKQRAYFKTGVTRNYDFRIEQLKKLKSCILEYRDEVLECLKADLGRPGFEGMMEYMAILDEMGFIIKRLKQRRLEQRRCGQRRNMEGLGWPERPSMN